MTDDQLSDFTQMELHIATLFTDDVTGRIVADNETDGELARRYFLGRT